MPKRGAACVLALAATAAVPFGGGRASAQSADSARENLVQALGFVRASDCVSAEPLLRLAPERAPVELCAPVF